MRRPSLVLRIFRWRQVLSCEPPCVPIPSRHTVKRNAVASGPCPLFMSGQFPSVSAPSSLRQYVLPILHGEQNARAVVETVAIFFGEVVDALTGRDFTLCHQSLANSLAEFRCSGLSLFQRHRHNTLQNQKRIVGVAGELATAAGTIFCLVGLVQRQSRPFGPRAVGLAVC